MTEKKCESCKYFLQHYSLKDGKIFRVFCGHCIFDRPRRKHPHSKICKEFVAGIRDTEAFATKEYLSKELLQYILSLELLPEITEDPMYAKQHCSEE